MQLPGSCPRPHPGVLHGSLFPWYLTQTGLLQPWHCPRGFPAFQPEDMPPYAAQRSLLHPKTHRFQELSPHHGKIPLPAGTEFLHFPVTPLSSPVTAMLLQTPPPYENHVRRHAFSPEFLIYREDRFPPRSAVHQCHSAVHKFFPVLRRARWRSHRSLAVSAKSQCLPPQVPVWSALSSHIPHKTAPDAYEVPQKNW